MHFIHIFFLMFKFKGKGKFVLPVIIISFLLVACMYEGLGILAGLKDKGMSGRLFMASGWLLAAAINSLVTKSYVISASGEKEYYEEEGRYMHIKVSVWTKLLIGFAVIAIIRLIFDIYGIFLDPMSKQYIYIFHSFKP